MDVLEESADASALPRGDPRWCQAELAGRLAELCGGRASATLSFALALVVDAQHAGEPCAWVTPRARCFFPPDADACGVDLDALAVVRVAAENELLVAADVLARSGACGLIVVDLGAVNVPLGPLARLAGLARAHAAAIVLLTEKTRDQPSLGSLVSLRADARFERRASGDFLCELAVSRDRRRATSWIRAEVRRGPPGLR
jgi:recombination protein RecA